MEPGELRFVYQHHAHWLACTLPLFLSVNSPLNHGNPSSSYFSSSFYVPNLMAGRQYLGRTPAGYLSLANSQLIIQKRAALIHIQTCMSSLHKVLQTLFHAILRQTCHTHLNPWGCFGRQACNSDMVVVWVRAGGRESGISGNGNVFSPFSSSCDSDHVTQQTRSTNTIREELKTHSVRRRC